MSRGDATTDSEELRLVISLGHTGDQQLYIRVSPEGAGELRALMEEEHIFCGDVLEFSATHDLAILAASVGAGTGGLAAALRAYFSRNRHKSIRLTHGDETIEIKGMTEHETGALLERVLDEAHMRQRELDEQWKQLRMGDDADPPN